MARLWNGHTKPRVPRSTSLRVASANRTPICDMTEAIPSWSACLTGVQIKAGQSTFEWSYILHASLINLNWGGCTTAKCHCNAVLCCLHRDQKPKPNSPRSIYQASDHRLFDTMSYVIMATPSLPTCLARISRIAQDACLLVIGVISCTLQQCNFI